MILKTSTLSCRLRRGHFGNFLEHALKKVNVFENDDFVKHSLKYQYVRFQNIPHFSTAMFNKE